MTRYFMRDTPLCQIEQQIFPVGTVETAVAAILRRSGVAAVVVVETGLALHEAFKGAVAAGCKNTWCRLLSALGIKKTPFSLQTNEKSALV